MVPGAWIPEWLLLGLLLGGTFALVALAAFVAGGRLFPAPSAGARRQTREGGEQRRREEIRAYLDGIGESYEEDREVDGHLVEFYLPDREVAVTFDAKAFLGLRDSTVHPVLCEHEMPGVHLGGRLPFETPDAGPTAGGDPGEDGEGPRWADGSFADRWRSRQAYWDGGRAGAGPDGPSGPGGPAAPPDRTSISASFAALGLGPDASGEEVRQAYRERIKEVHPDQGGDPEEFRRIQDAYATAKEHAD